MRPELHSDHIQRRRRCPDIHSSHTAAVAPGALRRHRSRRGRCRRRFSTRRNEVDDPASPIKLCSSPSAARTFLVPPSSACSSLDGTTPIVDDVSVRRRPGRAVLRAGPRDRVSRETATQQIGLNERRCCGRSEARAIDVLGGRLIVDLRFGHTRVRTTAHIEVSS